MPVLRWHFALTIRFRKNPYVPKIYSRPEIKSFKTIFVFTVSYLTCKILAFLKKMSHRKIIITTEEMIFLQERLKIL